MISNLNDVAAEVISQIHEKEKQQYFINAQITGIFYIDFETYIEPILNEYIEIRNAESSEEDTPEHNIKNLLKKLEIHILEQTIKSSKNKIIKPEIRFFNVPEYYNVPISDIGAETIEKLITTHGTIIAMEDNQTIISNAAFVCKGCARISYTEQHSSCLVEPAKCSECGGRSFKVIEEKSKFSDFKSVILEETNNAKTQQSRIKVELQGKLIKEIDLNDEIKIIGFSKRDDDGNKQNIKKNKIIANNIEKQDNSNISITPEDKKEIKDLMEKNKEDILDLLINSLAPDMNYPKEIKKALLCYLVKGSTLPNGSRKDIHILIVGDPGTGKSKLCRNIIRLAETFTIAEGTASTGVGLTASVVKEPLLNTNVLELGAFPKAHCGHCYIDEFDKLPKEQVQILLNALESGEMYFNKSGVHKNIKTEVSLLATANPKYDRFDPYKSLKDQFNMVDTILSRFDLIFIREDKPNLEQDTEIATHILTQQTYGTNVSDPESTPINDMISEDFLRKYLVYASQKEPQLTTKAREYLIKYYPKIRSENGDNNENIVLSDPRMLESFTRLSSAISKLKLKDDITEQEVNEAIELVNYSLHNVGQDIGNLRGYSTNKDKENREKILAIIKEENKETVTDGVQQNKILEIAKNELKISNSSVYDRLNELEAHNDIYKIKNGRNIFYKPKY